MSVQSVTTSNVQAANVKYEAAAKAAETKPAAEETKVPKTDSFVKSEERQDVGYGQVKGLSAEQVDKLNEERVNSLKSMIQKLISEQAGRVQNGTFQSVDFSLSIEYSSTSSVSGSIYDDPTYGVDAMATNLMNMAIALSGGDSDKADTLMNAVYKGFEMAEKAWGGKLPGVCQSTLAEVENRFAYWKENGSLTGYEFGGYKVMDE